MNYNSPPGYDENWDPWEELRQAKILGSGPLAQRGYQPPETPSGGGYADQPSGGLWESIRDAASQAASGIRSVRDFAKPALSLAADAMGAGVSGDPAYATKRFALEEQTITNRREAAIEESRMRASELKGERRQKTFDYYRANPPTTKEERQRAGMDFAEVGESAVAKHMFGGEGGDLPKQLPAIEEGDEKVYRMQYPDGTIEEISRAPRWKYAGAKQLPAIPGKNEAGEDVMIMREQTTDGDIHIVGEAPRWRPYRTQQVPPIETDTEKIFRVQNPDDSFSEISRAQRFKPPEEQSKTVYSPETGEPIYEEKRGPKDKDELGLTPPTKTDLDKKILTAQDRLAQMDDLENKFRPEFLEWGTRLQVAWDSLKAKGGQGLSDEEYNLVTDYATFRAASLYSMSIWLNALSGAAITAQEYERLSRYMPNPGTGILDGDDFATFYAKMKYIQAQSKLGLLRYQFERRNGKALYGSEIDIFTPNGLIQAYGKEKMDSLRSQGVPEEDAKKQTSEYVGKLFGKLDVRPPRVDDEEAAEASKRTKEFRAPE